MVKLIYCIRKRDDLTDEEFARYWKEVHGPIGAKIPRLRRLVQNHLHRVTGGPYAPTYDGVAELWFDSEEDLLAARKTPEWAASTADEANFIDPDTYGYLVAVEHEVQLLDRRESAPRQR
jgi:uncharacterized protein (TIGR02118 family)